MTGGKRFHGMVLLLAAIAGFAVLLPGAHGPFILDDFVNLAGNPNFQAGEWTTDAVRKAVFSNDSGPLGRPVSMLTFVGNVATTGMVPGPMKVTNAILHGIAALLLGLILLRLFAAASTGPNQGTPSPAPWLATACWALHPIAVTSTLYVIQRMNLLAALFTLAALLAYLAARPWFFRSWPRALAWLLLALLSWILGVLSKENALLAPLYVVLMEWLVFRFRDAHGQERRAWRKVVVGGVCATTIAAIVVLVLTWTRWESGFETRPFTMSERLVTEPRVIWRYVSMILLPGHSRLGLFLDDIPLSSGLLHPWTTFLSLAGLAAAVVGAVVLRKRAPLVSFGVLFFLAGHLLESTFIALEIAFEHRNYLPSIGLLIAAASSLQLLARRLRADILGWLPLAAFGLFLAFFTVIRSIHWSDSYLLAQVEAYHHPQSARAQTQLGFIYTQFARQTSQESGWRAFYMDAATGYFRKAITIDPNIRTPLFLWLLNARSFGMPFPEDAHVELLDRLRYGVPTMDTPGSLKSLYECTLDACGVSPSELETLFRLTLENPGLRGRIRSETLVEAAKYFRFIRNDPASTKALLTQAVEASPANPRFRLFLARELLSRGDTVAALAQIGEIEKLDEWGAFDAEISRLLKLAEKTDDSPGETNGDTESLVDHSSRQE